MRWTKKTAAVLLISLVTATAASGDWKADLSVEPAITLPGVPVSFTVRLTNVGGMPARAPEHMIMTAQGAGRAVLLAPCGDPVVTFQELENVTVAPGATVVAVLPNAGTLWSPTCSDDSRLSLPGVYEYRAYVGDFDTLGEMDRSRALLVAKEHSSASARASLTVAEPVGDDAVAWRKMNSVTGSGWTSGVMMTQDGQQLAKLILRELPRSTYAGWLAATGVGSTHEARADALRAWLDQAPVDDLTDRRWIRIMDWELATAAEHGGINPVLRQRYAARALRAAKRLRAEHVRADALARIRTFYEEGGFRLKEDD